MTAPVGSYEDGTSPYGAYDMAGNVSEWVADWYATDYYRNSVRTEPLGPETGVSRVLRGGSYAARHTFYIGVDGKILYVDAEVKPGSAGDDVANRLDALGIQKR